MTWIKYQLSYMGTYNMSIYQFNRLDGTVAISRPGDSGWSMTKILAAQRIADEAKGASPIISAQVISEEDLPKDISFRDAWTHGPKGVLFEDVSKCGNILRKKRNELLKLHSETIVDQQENPKGDVAKVRRRMQELRDIPQTDVRFKSEDLVKLRELSKELDREHKSINKAERSTRRDESRRLD